MISTDNGITDVEATFDTTPTLTQRQMTQGEVLDMVRATQLNHNAKCRKKGFVGHASNPAGSKLERKIERQGSLYGRVSTVGQLMLEMQTRKFKEAKENKAAKIRVMKNEIASARIGIHQTNTNNPIDFPAAL